ncbi:hypothetical protein [Halorussus caseinilyticus]|uniref:Uncharacterized protein n=1 Tax=Halorussus caseinilyticus TaxID=3034025 RepID=A0ABD5WND3_9EURY|nr:hypothetical protein [Halorussus sp. DT72]
MSGFWNEAAESIAERPKLMKAAWLLTLLLIEVGSVVADGGSSGP